MTCVTKNRVSLHQIIVSVHSSTKFVSYPLRLRNINYLFISWVQEQLADSLVERATTNGVMKCNRGSGLHIGYT